MSAVIIDGKAVAEKLYGSLNGEVKSLTAKGKTPGLAVVLVGNDPASAVYVRNKVRTCEKLGIYSEKHELPAETPQAELLSLIAKLNQNPKIHGILVQQPLPGHIDEKVVNENILPEKDVDAFNPENVGKLMLGDKGFVSCTPAGVMELLRDAGIPPQGKECVVVGRSNIVGKPMALLLLAAHGTVTICHSRTKDLAEVCRRADILVAAVGRANFVTGDMVKPGAVVIDVGINRGDDGKLCGDAEYESVSKVAGYITPVPGGVGPMTIAMLMKNTVQSAMNS
ncbi:MAG: bifunctional methylenetetrahydrofolate dehydrogenase/methenyltetrahydrofolate cyclohydrolase FolD [Oscillospiraceae bacterium]|nr:bifunctional methylenetetrahydrofolate dehydrogenase/methenyltetrahydrofolate cyclohydrolase FolD [Oscillospiraceae bacterium]